MSPGSIAARPGTYTLILQNHKDRVLTVGRSRELYVKPGYYLYTGSAFGPGGVRGRVERHRRRNKKKHWHLDYIREHMEVSAVLVSYDPRHLEHDWAGTLGQSENIYSVENFGCSDCNCLTHLFFCPRIPDLELYSRTLEGTIERLVLGDNAC